MKLNPVPVSSLQPTGPLLCSSVHSANHLPMTSISWDTTRLSEGVSSTTKSGTWIPPGITNTGALSVDRRGPPGRNLEVTVALFQGSSPPLQKMTRSNSASQPAVHAFSIDSVKPRTEPMLKPPVVGNMRAHCREKCSGRKCDETMLVPSDLGGPTCHQPKGLCCRFVLSLEFEGGCKSLTSGTATYA